MPLFSSFIEAELLLILIFFFDSVIILFLALILTLFCFVKNLSFNEFNELESLEVMNFMFLFVISLL